MSWPRMGGKGCFLEKSGEAMLGDHLVSCFYLYILFQITPSDQSSQCHLTVLNLWIHTKSIIKLLSYVLKKVKLCAFVHYAQLSINMFLHTFFFSKLFSFIVSKKGYVLKEL